MADDNFPDLGDLQALVDQRDKSRRRLPIDQMLHCRLLALPAEVRDCIWMYCHLDIPVITVLTAKAGLRLRTSRKHEHLRLTCRQIDQETQIYRSTPKYRGAPKCSETATWILKLPYIDYNKLPDVVQRLVLSKQSRILSKATHLDLECGGKSLINPPYGVKGVWLRLLNVLPRLRRIDISQWNTDSAFDQFGVELKHVELMMNGIFRSESYDDYLRDFPSGRFDEHYVSPGNFVASILSEISRVVVEIYLESSQSFSREGRNHGQVVPIEMVGKGPLDFEPVHHVDTIEFLITTDVIEPEVISRKRRFPPSGRMLSSWDDTHPYETNKVSSPWLAG